MANNNKTNKRICMNCVLEKNYNCPALCASSVEARVYTPAHPIIAVTININEPLCSKKALCFQI